MSIGQEFLPTPNMVSQNLSPSQGFCVGNDARWEGHFQVHAKPDESATNSSQTSTRPKQHPMCALSLQRHGSFWSNSSADHSAHLPRLGYHTSWWKDENILNGGENFRDFFATFALR